MKATTDRQNQDPERDLVPPPSWAHSGFGADSALEAMKRVERTKPRSDLTMQPCEAGQCPTAAGGKRQERRKTGSMLRRQHAI